MLSVDAGVLLFLIASTACRDDSVFMRFGEHRSPDGTIPEIEFAPSSEDFYRKFFLSSTPVIIRGGARHWPAFTLWNNLTYLNTTHGDSKFVVEKRKQFRNSHAVKNTMKLHQFLERFETENLYLDSVFDTNNPMLDDIMLPVPLQCRELSKGINSVILLMSSGNTSSAFHHDGYQNFLTVLSGEKDVMLFNSSYTAALHGDDFDVVPGVSPLEPEAVDMSKFGFIKDVPYIQGKINAGDMIYIPQYWWHHVRSHGNPNIAFGIWFNIEEVYSKMVEIPPKLVVKETKAFAKALRRMPDTIKCSNHVKQLDQFLSVDPDARSSLNLRIPKKNERPPATLLASGYTMPVLGFGTSNLDDSVVQSVKYALEFGYRMFDSAELYVGSEEGIAQALLETGIPREEVFITTKINPRSHGYSTTLDAIDASLHRLNTTYIDLYYIHSPDCTDCEEEPGTWQDTWLAMEHAHNEGKIRSLGVSNFNLKQLKELATFATIPLSTVQNWFDPFHQERKLRRYCRENNIRFVGYSTLGYQWVAMGMPENPVLSLDLVIEIASHHDYIASHVLLRWAVHENVTVIPRSSNRNHIAQNYRAMDIKLHPSDIKAMRNLEKLMREVFEEVQGAGENNATDIADENADDTTDGSSSAPDAAAADDAVDASAGLAPDFEATDNTDADSVAEDEREAGDADVDVGNDPDTGNDAIGLGRSHEEMAENEKVLLPKRDEL